MGPDGGADPAGVDGAALAWWLAAALGAADATGALGAVPGAPLGALDSPGPKAQPEPVAAGAQAASPATAARPPPARAALRRNPPPGERRIGW